MRQNSLLAEKPKVARRQSDRISYPTGGETNQSWRVRAQHDAMLVNRAIRGANDQTTCAMGFARAVRALNHGSVGELLMTRRFVERHPVAAANTMLLAEIAGARITTVTGPAELHLDLAAGGVAALTRTTERARNGNQAAASVRQESRRT